MPLTPGEYDEARRIFHLVVDLPPDERQAQLNRLCVGKPWVRQEVESLLASDQANGTESAPSRFVQDDSRTPTATQGSDGPGMQIGPYRILEKLGEGGMGVVYLAEQREPVHRRVALKLIREAIRAAHPDDNAVKEIIARFEAERQALAMMNHEGIAKLYDAWTTDDGRPYFTMEFVEGIPLTAFCKNHRLTVDDRLKLFLQVCKAIQHAHHRGVIHRDLKPSNILVSSPDNEFLAKVIDFGVARATNQRLTEKTFYTEIGRVIGTLDYMSPEQAAMTGEGVDARTDVYSLGVILYELLVGQRPIELDQRRVAFDEIVRRIREDEPPTPSVRWSRLNLASAKRLADERRTNPAALARRVHGDLDWIAMKALDKERNRRYATAGKLAQDIENHLKDEPVEAGPPSASYRLKKLARKHRVLTSLVVMAVVLVMGLGLWFMYGFWQRIVEARGLFVEAGKHATTLLERKETLRSLQDANRVIPEFPQPVWQIQGKIQEWNRMDELERQIGESYSGALEAFRKAIEIAPAVSGVYQEARSALAQFHWDNYSDAVADRPIKIGRAYFRFAVKSQGVERYDALVESSPVTLVCETPGTSVHCFRYEKSEGHLVPLPYHPREGVRGRPYLQVKRIDPSRSLPFRVGDRIVSVNGAAIFERTDFMNELDRVGAGESVQVKVRRGQVENVVDWIPFSGDDGPGKVLDLFTSFGFLFEGYPLDRREECLLGVLAPGSRLTIRLPEGSYLFSLTKNGYAECRLPLVLPRDSGKHEARLFRETEVPDGFVHIPASTAHLGGDEQSYHGLPRGSAAIDHFFMKRLEVTFAEYLQFLNAPANRDRIDPNGTAAPLAGWGAVPIRDVVLEKARIPLVPRLDGNRLLFERAEATGQWRLGKRLNPELPVGGISLLAAMEYAHWLSGESDTWNFRLPGDKEWEKAARGADRRLFVWGNLPVATYCRSALGSNHSGLCEGGRYPLDESVYGVMDMAGLVSEPIPEAASERWPFIIQRGGNANATDYRDYHVATRNRRFADLPWSYLGIRLVAELKKPSN